MMSTDHHRARLTFVDTVYLDHAGTVPYSKSLMQRYAKLMTENLFGNPHSISSSAQASTRTVDDARLELLRFLGADPVDFDLVFVANATAGIRLVAEAFRDQPEPFKFFYHNDSHTSLVGIRELARDHLCLSSDSETEAWLRRSEEGLCLFGYPAQSNMDGRRLPLDWALRNRQRGSGRHYTLLDAAAHLSTSPLDLSNALSAPDFTVFSLYKIFGFPDLGALVVRKAAAPIFERRRYFGGGTVDVVTLHDEQWHVKKSDSLHALLEDGTLPIHSIAAVKPALQTHAEMYGSLAQISRHTAWLAHKLYKGLSSLRHANHSRVVQIYADPNVDYTDTDAQGPIVAFNLKDDTGAWINNSEVEKLAAIRNIHLRTGGLCNPGGVASALKLAPWEMRENFSAGHRCGAEDSVVNGKPTGVIRASLGASSTLRDVEHFLAFVTEFFVSVRTGQHETPVGASSGPASNLVIDSLTIYPVKSCAGYQIPANETWTIGPEGMQWDREWCIVHQGTDTVLSQKQYPRMALIRPSINTRDGLLELSIPETSSTKGTKLSVPLSHDPRPFKPRSLQNASVCDDQIKALHYVSEQMSDDLSEFLDVRCQLARFPAARTSTSTRHSKAHLASDKAPAAERPIMFSNESPILTINRSSVDALNENIAARSSLSNIVIAPSAFRANIVLATASDDDSNEPQAWSEDSWTRYEVTHGGMGTPGLGPLTTCDGNVDSTLKSDREPTLVESQVFNFDVLGPCRRCQMVCIDQTTGERQAEPFVTLAKTRRMAFPTRRRSDQKTDITSGGERTLNEKAANEEAANEKTANEKTANEKTANEKTANEKTANEKTANEKTANEKATNEKATYGERTINEKTSTRHEDKKMMQGVFFGVHTALATRRATGSGGGDGGAVQARIRVGDAVRAFSGRDLGSRI